MGGRCEIVQLMRIMQNKLIEQTSSHTQREIAARSSVKFTGSICPPSADFVDPFDRVNVLMFWHMAHLLESMARILKEHDPEFATTHDATLLEQLQTSYNPSSIRENAMHVALVRVCGHAARSSDSEMGNT